MILATIALVMSLTQNPIPPGICPVYCNKWICGWQSCKDETKAQKICAVKPCYKYPQ